MAVLFAAVVVPGGPSAGIVGFDDDSSPEEITTRVVGGVTAPTGAYPFAVYVRIETFACGGSLISPTWVVTAAHCVVRDGAKRAPSNNTFVVIPRDNVNLSDGEAIRITRIEVPPRALTSDNDDIALLELESPSTFGTPVAFAGPTDAGTYAAGRQAKVVGWGATNPNGSSASTSTLLQELDLQIRSDSVCVETWFGYEPANSVCAGGIPNEDACLGDSGGPLLVQVSGSWLLVGVVSAGWLPCGEEVFPGSGRSRPGIYTEVASYTSFIACATGIGRAPGPANGTASACATAVRLGPQG